MGIKFASKFKAPFPAFKKKCYRLIFCFSVSRHIFRSKDSNMRNMGCDLNACITMWFRIA